MSSTALFQVHVRSRPRTSLRWPKILCLFRRLVDFLTRISIHRWTICVSWGRWYLISSDSIGIPVDLPKWLSEHTSEVGRVLLDRLKWSSQRLPNLSYFIAFNCCFVRFLCLLFSLVVELVFEDSNLKHQSEGLLINLNYHAVEFYYGILKQMRQYDWLGHSYTISRQDTNTLELEIFQDKLYSIKLLYIKMQR